MLLDNMVISQKYVGDDALMDGLLNHLARGYVTHIAPMCEKSKSPRMASALLSDHNANTAP
eukprot:684719-Pleurochrysis_carterae.AAC.1